ncbi:MAG: PH domain-containing protein [Planctomycetota bacterium]
MSLIPSEDPMQENEETLYVASPSMFRNHPIGFVLTLILSLVGVGLVIFLVWYLRARSTELTVTNLRTRLHRGWLSRQISEVWHRDIRNVQLNQTLMQRLLGTGRIGISSSGTSGLEIDVGGLRGVDGIKSLIDKYRATAASTD